jgi:proteasome inhibitor subunit 1 (PI31)
MEAATLAVVRASRPSFRSDADKLAFAVHAFLLAEGYKLVATGAAAEDEGADWGTDREEVATSDWDSLEGAYAFRYQDSQGSRSPLYVKCLSAGPQLLVHWVPGGSAAAVNTGSSPEPHTLELEVGAYTTDAPAAPACYKDADKLVQQLSQCFSGALGSGKAGTAAGAAAAAGSSGRQGEAATASGSGRAEREDPLREPAGVSGIGYRPPGIPVGIGADDVVPPGVPPPGYGGGPGFPGLMEPGPLRGGGGMHVGPGDPIFGSGRMGGGVGGPPGHGPGMPGLPPGARWDPIAPPGMRGFHPDDYQQQPGRVHPDMAQPGPGRGTDFDQMFG